MWINEMGFLFTCGCVLCGEAGAHTREETQEIEVDLHTQPQCWVSICSLLLFSVFYSIRTPSLLFVIIYHLKHSGRENKSIKFTAARWGGVGVFAKKQNCIQRNQNYLFF